MPPDKASAQSAGSETIEELFIALESPLLGYATRLVGQPNVAEDMVQEAFMRLHTQFAEVREPRRWLYRTVHNLSLNYSRQANKLVPLHPTDEESGAPGLEHADSQSLPDEQIAHLECIGLVRLSLKTLDERSRELIRLKFNEGLSYEKMAARTGLTVGHVGYLLHHAIKAIGQELAKNGVVP